MIFEAGPGKESRCSILQPIHVQVGCEDIFNVYGRGKNKRSTNPYLRDWVKNAGTDGSIRVNRCNTGKNNRNR